MAFTYDAGSSGSFPSGNYLSQLGGYFGGGPTQGPSPADQANPTGTAPNWGASTQGTQNLQASLARQNLGKGIGTGANIVQQALNNDKATLPTTMQPAQSFNLAPAAVPGNNTRVNFNTYGI